VPGALVIQPERDPAPKTPVVRTAEPVTDSDIAELIDNLRSAPLGISQRVRISLGGVQEKLLLTHVSSATWGRPVDGTPSTHILKPQIRGIQPDRRKRSLLYEGGRLCRLACCLGPNHAD